MADEAATIEKPNTLIEQTGDVPETVIPPNAKEPEAVPDTPAEATPEAKAEEVKTPEEPKKRVPWYQERIDRLTREKNEERKKVAEFEVRLKALEAPTETTETKPFDPKQFDSLVEQRAAQIAAQKAYEAKAESWIHAGQKEYGAAQFNEICNEVAAMGAGDSPEFMQIVTDHDIIPDGHKVLAALRDHPEDAQRIVNLPPVKMAAALVAFANKAKPEPAQISRAPEPIKPIGGSAKSSEPADDDPYPIWLAKRKAQVEAKRKAH